MSAMETVSLRIPLKAEYVSIARLTASGIASLMGFDFDAIEDIKVSLSEIIGKIIEIKPSDDHISIEMSNVEDGISISFILNDNNAGNIFDNDEDSFSLAIVSALMDQIKMVKSDNTVITITKGLGKAI
ncbi:MAG: anti-sigma regulatory factor [Clostridiaceae bacterium]|nr:anti-sigma regulatory factor [Clostridiaceae bacterium]